MGGGLYKAASFFDIPAETFPGVAKFTVIGGESIIVENCRRICEFSGELIVLECGRRQLRLRGSGFVLDKLSSGELRVSGRFLYAEMG